MERIAERVRRLRESRQWNQKELAERADVSRSLLSKLESGAQTEPSAVHLQRIATALGVPLSDLTDPPPAVPPSLEERLRQLRPDDQEWLDRVLASVLALPPDERAAAASMLEQMISFRMKSAPKPE